MPLGLKGAPRPRGRGRILYPLNSPNPLFPLSTSARTDPLSAEFAQSAVPRPRGRGRILYPLNSPNPLFSPSASAPTDPLSAEFAKSAVLPIRVCADGFHFPRILTNPFVPIRVDSWITVIMR